MVDQVKNLGKISGEVAKRLLIVLLEIGEGFLDGLYRSVAYPHMNFSKYTGSYRSVYNSVKRLEKRGFVRTQIQGKKLKIQLTDRGYRYAQALELLSLKLSKPKRWDGKWRFLIFDIPEEHKIVREVLRERIKQLGLVQLQKSVFVIPWPCKDIVEKIQKVYQAHRYIRYIEASSFDGEEVFRNRFGIDSR